MSDVYKKPVPEDWPITSLEIIKMKMENINIAVIEAICVIREEIERLERIKEK